MKQFIVLLFMIIGFCGCSKEKTVDICKEWVLSGTTLNPNNVSGQNYDVPFTDITFTNFPKRYSTILIDIFGTELRAAKYKWKWTDNFNSIELDASGWYSHKNLGAIDIKVELLTDTSLWLNFGDTATSYYTTSN